MLKRSLLASTCILTLAGAANAADLTPLPPPPVFTWAGFYLGGQIGYGWATDNGNIYNFGPLGPIAAANAVAPSSTSPDGVVGGAHVGYNWQLAQWVFGLEGDVDGTSLKQTILPLPYVSSTTNLFIQGTILGRVGYAFDHLLVYAIGGGTWGGIHNTYNVSGTIASYPTARSGWTVGGGLEYAVTDNWSLRAEYRYANFGFFYDSPIVYFVTQTHHWTENQVKLGFSYKFTSPPPVAVVSK
ncbi:MAG TPA: outer membrane protein [Methylocella sp.]|nr:outer membrane protein [Methylocella sp.]